MAVINAARQVFKTLHTVLCVLFLLSCPTSVAAEEPFSGDAKAEFSMNAFVENADFRIVISPKGSDGSNSLKIDCVKYCKSRLFYQEKISDAPISIFRLWDGSNQVISIWSAGSVYRVRIYFISKLKIAKVLDEATKRSPQFIFDKSGSPVIILSNTDQPSFSISTSGVIWRWAGQSYLQGK